MQKYKTAEFLALYRHYFLAHLGSRRGSSEAQLSRCVLPKENAHILHTLCQETAKEKSVRANSLANLKIKIQQAEIKLNGEGGEFLNCYNFQPLIIHFDLD